MDKRKSQRKAKSAKRSKQVQVDKGNGEKDDCIKRVFDFEKLPVELKHVIFKMFNTIFLEKCCTQVSRSWQGIVEDVLRERRLNASTDGIPLLYRMEMAKMASDKDLNDPLEVVKFCENKLLSKSFCATSIEVNRDALSNHSGLLGRLWELRYCECKGATEIAECLMRRIHVIPAFNLFVMDCDVVHGKLRFFNLCDMERLGMNEKAKDIESYNCPNVYDWLRLNHTTDTGISVFRDHIAVEAAARSVLLLKIASVDHDRKQVNIVRVRQVYLPLSAARLCLFENKLLVLYTTGSVGTYDIKQDELFMSLSKCDMRDRVYMNVSIHRIKLIRLGSLVLIRISEWLWYVVDSNDTELEIHTVRTEVLFNLMGDTIQTIKNRSRSKAHIFELNNIDIWSNCLITDFYVRRSTNNTGSGEYKRFARYLDFKRIGRYPTINDFKDPSVFSNEVISLNDSRMPVAVQYDSKLLAGYNTTAPFVPVSLKPWQLEPKVGEPVPVADLIAAALVKTDSGLKMKAFRIRLSNHPVTNDKKP